MGGIADSPTTYQKLRMTIPGAYVTLAQKNSLFNSDRLAILSNLAHYPSRIKTDHAVREGLSFTACVVAIALFNGDLTLPYSARILTPLAPVRKIPPLIRLHGYRLESFH